MEYGFADSQTPLEVWSVNPLQIGEDDFMGKEPGKKLAGSVPRVAVGSFGIRTIPVPLPHFKRHTGIVVGDTSTSIGAP